ncbi:hypothetical protein AHAS_Ahas13G0087000 [Arachis hypogaea]
MHDLLIKLGRSIVREKTPKEPRNWSRLWNQKDLSDVLWENKTADNIEAIVLPRYEEIREGLSVEALSQMNRLKLLILGKPNKLVKLILLYSNIKELWEGIKNLHNLTHMELCHSKNLIKIPNLSGASNLSRLDLEGCVALVYLDPSIGSLEKLHFLNLENCKNLSPWQREQLKKLDPDQSVERHMTSSSMCKTLTRPFQFLYSRRRANSVGLLVPCLSRFPALVTLDISFCNLLQIPEAIGNLRCLESLNMGGNNIWLPSTFFPIGGRSRGRDYDAGIYVFNCPNLSDTEGCRVTVISWMIKMIQVYMQCSIPRYIIDVVIPGAEIPWWFNRQNTAGSSVSLEPSPILEDNNWIGIACCVIFVVHDAPSKWLEEANHSPVLGCGFHGYQLGGKYAVVPIRLKQDLIATELDHMWLIFFSRELFINGYISDLKEGASDLDGIELDTMSDYPEVVEVRS